MKISEMSIEQLRNHFAELSRDQLLLSLQTRDKQLDAVQQIVRLTDGELCATCNTPKSKHRKIITHGYKEATTSR